MLPEIPSLHSQSLLRGYLRTLMICLLAVLLLGQKHLGFVLVFFTPFALLYQLISLFFARHKPAERIHRYMKIMIILFASGMIVLIHLYHSHEARQAAETVREAVTAFRAAHQRYPVSLNEISSDTATFAASNRIFYRGTKPDDFLLFYMATETLHRVWRYNALTGLWEKSGG